MTSTPPLLTSLIPHTPARPPQTETNAAESRALTADEQHALDRLERTIERGLRTFIEVGQALAEIRESRLYRRGHATFEDYTAARWGFGRRRADQLIVASRVGTNVLTALPDAIRNNGLNEAQARELQGLEPEQAVEVYRATAAEHSGPLTARLVRAKRRALHPAPSNPRKGRSKPFNAAKAQGESARSTIELIHRVVSEGIDRSAEPAPASGSPVTDLLTIVTAMRAVDFRALAADLAPSLSAQDQHAHAKQLAALALDLMEARKMLLPGQVRTQGRTTDDTSGAGVRGVGPEVLNNPPLARSQTLSEMPSSCSGRVTFAKLTL